MQSPKNNGFHAASTIQSTAIFEHLPTWLDEWAYLVGRMGLPVGRMGAPGWTNGEDAINSASAFFHLVLVLTAPFFYARSQICFRKRRVS